MHASHATPRPLSRRALERLSDADLSLWVRTSQAEWLDSHRISWRRWRWRRASARARRAFAGRLRRHGGSSPARCDRCRRSTPTVHCAYGHGAALHFGRFCERCATLEPPGWFVVAHTALGRARLAI